MPSGQCINFLSITILSEIKDPKNAKFRPDKIKFSLYGICCGLVINLISVIFFLNDKSFLSNLINDLSKLNKSKFLLFLKISILFLSFKSFKDNIFFLSVLVSPGFEHKPKLLFFTISLTSPFA